MFHFAPLFPVMISLHFGQSRNSAIKRKSLFITRKNISRCIFLQIRIKFIEIHLGAAPKNNQILTGLMFKSSINIRLVSETPFFVCWAKNN